VRTGEVGKVSVVEAIFDVELLDDVQLELVWQGDEAWFDGCFLGDFDR